MYSEGSGWGAAAGGIFGFSWNLFTSFEWITVEIFSFLKTALTRHMYSEGSGCGAEAGGIFGFNCFTPFFFAGRGLGIGFVLPSYRFIQMLTCPLLLDLSNMRVSLLRNKSFSNKTIASLNSLVEVNQAIKA